MQAIVLLAHIEGLNWDQAGTVLNNAWLGGMTLYKSSSILLLSTHPYNLDTAKHSRSKAFIAAKHGQKQTPEAKSEEFMEVWHVQLHVVGRSLMPWKSSPVLEPSVPVSV